MKYVILIFTLWISSIAVAADPKLCDEISLDPLGRGYAGMSLEQISADLQMPYRTRWKGCVDGNLMRDQITGADWLAIETDTLRDRLIAVLVGCVNPQGFARTRVIEILGSGESLSNMAAVAQHHITRAEDIGVSDTRPGVIQECL
jgi:hypothetical protein